MRPYSQDLRERVVCACDEGRGTRQQIADLFGVSTAWIRRLLQRRRATGSFASMPHGGGTPFKLTARHRDRLLGTRHRATRRYPGRAARPPGR